MNYLAYILGLIFSILFYLFADLIIKIWIGNEYIMSNYIVKAFSIQLFIIIYRTSLWQYTTVKGWFEINKRSDLIGIMINFVFSILLYIKYEIIGVILGTIISQLFQHIFELILITKKINNNSKELLYKNIKYILLYLIVISLNKELYLILPIGGYLMQAFFNISVIEVAPLFYIGLGLLVNRDKYSIE